MYNRISALFSNTKVILSPPCLWKRASMEWWAYLVNIILLILFQNVWTRMTFVSGTLKLVGLLFSYILYMMFNTMPNTVYSKPHPLPLLKNIGLDDSICVSSICRIRPWWWSRYSEDSTMYCVMQSQTFYQNVYSTGRIALFNSSTDNTKWWNDELYSLRAGRSGDRIPVGAKFSALVQTGFGARRASCTVGSGSSPAKRQGRGVDHSPPSSAEVKERVEL